MAILLPHQVSADSSWQIVCEARATLLDDGRPKCSFFNDTHQSYGPIMYPVLFPHGTNGYHDNLRSIVEEDGKFNKISLAMYVRY